MSTDIPAGDATLLLERDIPSFAWLVIVTGARRGRLIRLRVAGSTLGRASENDIVVDDPATSRHHARFTVELASSGQRFVIHDLASANGIFVNGNRVSRCELTDEDRIVIGETTYAFKQL